VDALLDARSAAVPNIVAGLSPFRGVVDPYLRELQKRSDLNERQKARIALALLPVDPDQAPALRERMLKADPEEFVVIREALAPLGDALKADLWKEAAEASSVERRFRAVVALARFDPDNDRWRSTGDRIVNRFLEANPLHLGPWTEALRPVRTSLIEPLRRVFHDARAGDKRQTAASILADYLADQPEVLAELLKDADPKQFAVLWPKLQGRRELLVAAMTAELDKTAGLHAEEPAKNALAQRQVRAAVALLRADAPDRVWPLFEHRPDPRLRSYLIHQLAPLEADPALVVDRFGREPNISTRRALLLTLGEFGDAVPADRKAALTEQLLTAYRNDPDPGMHGAIDWLLRQRWGRSADLLAADQALRGQPAGERRWYVNSQGQTMALFPGPVEFPMGSPDGEPGRFASETLHRQRIGRSFALATKKATVDQFERFLKAHPEVKHSHPQPYAPDPDCPIISITWFEAAQYCRWLSEAEGIPDDQMCYPKIADIKEGMRMPAGYLSRTGYRLPTEAEWEYANRADAVTSRCYGQDDSFMGQYGWSVQNAEERTWPVGRLKPNDFGLFDAHGNTYDWIQNRSLAYSTKDTVVEDSEDTAIVRDADGRELRGGSFDNSVAFLRSAYRNNNRPTNRNHRDGLRVARTYR
jgi:formylglycine-generating enzyme required for sulfatase activity